MEELDRASSAALLATLAFGTVGIYVGLSAASTDVSLPVILTAQFVRLLIVIAGAPALAKLLARVESRTLVARR